MKKTENLFALINASYKKVVNGIAFIPSLISVGLLLLAILLIGIQSTPLGGDVLASINFIQVQQASTARALLGALLTGMISLSVFSFSMVMVVVNQSASNFSPKVIEGLISRNVNQVILGIYIGTILFITISLTQVGNQNDFDEIPHFNVFSSILLMTLSIALFILFIQKISDSVRITNVAENIFLDTRESLEENSEGNMQNEYPVDGDWYEYKAHRSGYLQSIASKRLIKLLSKDGLKLKVIPHYGTYVLGESALFCLNKKIEDEDLLSDIRGTFTMYSGENVKENYFYGFRQLREVAVKGLSPGINDPGIAIICLDYLSQLLSLYMNHEKSICVKDEDSGASIFHRRHSFSEILNLSIAPIHLYGKKDHIVLGQILKTLSSISLYDSEKVHRQTLNAHASSVLESAEELRSVPERGYMNEVMVEMNGREYFDLPQLKV